MLDLVGNVWQWTDEFHDDHTRAAMLRGGSHYQPQTSHWYFPQAYRLDQHGKYLLMAPSNPSRRVAGVADGLIASRLAPTVNAFQCGSEPARDGD